MLHRSARLPVLLFFLSNQAVNPNILRLLRTLAEVSELQVDQEGLPTLRIPPAGDHAQARPAQDPASPGSCSETGGLR
jgi:hypothetical protein